MRYVLILGYVGVMFRDMTIASLLLLLYTSCVLFRVGVARGSHGFLPLLTILYDDISIAQHIASCYLTITHKSF